MRADLCTISVQNARVGKKSLRLRQVTSLKALATNQFVLIVCSFSNVGRASGTQIYNSQRFPCDGKMCGDADGKAHIRAEWGQSPAINHFPTPSSSPYPVSMNTTRKLPPLSYGLASARLQTKTVAPITTVGIVFAYFQNFGSFLALQVDITFETNTLLRHNTTPPLNAISRLTTVFTTHKKRLMSSGQPSPRTTRLSPLLIHSLARLPDRQL